MKNPSIQELQDFYKLADELLDAKDAMDWLLSSAADDFTVADAREYIRKKFLGSQEAGAEQGGSVPAPDV